MPHIGESDDRNCNQVRRARRRHRHLRARNPSLAPAVPGGGMVLHGTVALPLEDGDIAVYEVVASIQYRCRPARSCGPVIEMALDRLADVEACVRAAQQKTNIVHLPLAAE